MADEAALVAHHEALSARDYNRTKAGLGSSAPSEGADASAVVGVAAHYNAFADRHRSLTSGSDILHLRNLNNWVKSVLIKKHLPVGNRRRGAAVLDLACGKGGDMLKFKAGNVALYVGLDIAVQSVRDAVHRYAGGGRHPPMHFAARFLAGDFCDPEPSHALARHLPDGMQFALASVQMALHYSFRTEATARALLSNAAASLHAGGTLIATVPDANVLVRRLRASAGLSFGNGNYISKYHAHYHYH